MADQPSRDAQRSQSEPPTELANVAPDLGGSGQTRLIIQAIEPTITELRNEMRDIRKSASTDFRWIIGGFIIVGGMLIAGYFRLDDRISKLEEKFSTITNQTTRIDTKLEDLLQRIPPIPTPPPRRQ
jgi:hypothetical protein